MEETSSLPSVCSEQEELREWRDKLKEQVEEDIERQVQLRLKSDASYMVKCNHSRASEVFRYRLKCNSKSKLCGRVLINGKLSTKPILSENSVNILEATKHQKNWKISSLQSPYKANQINIKDQRTVYSFRNGARTLGGEFCPTSGKSVMSDPHSSNTGTFYPKRIQCGSKDLTGIYEYVHQKYGCPHSQLSLLSKSKRFKTRSLDTSGCGCGPIINSPIESKISLSTPKHFDCICESESRVGPSPDCSHFVRRHDCDVHNKDNKGHRPPPTCLRSGKRNNSNDNSRNKEYVLTEQLEFESKFESGNLWKTSQIGPREYDIWMSPDLYSKRHTQWFYFRIKGMVAEHTYKFHIVNFMKPDSLYNHGMQPLLYSEKLMDLEHQGWRRVGENITYHKTKSSHSDFLMDSLYTLNWTMEFPHAKDTCYLAYCFPYPYSRLLSHLEIIGKCPQRAKYFSQQVLCQTLAGNACPLITISNIPDNKKCPGIIISARVHPGETNSSWVMEGLINYLLSDAEYAQELRNNYVFKLIPMLNPDGVIVGNYRTSLAGMDLNRVYKYPESTLFPTVYHTKQLICDFMKERQLLLYVDLHGHSRKRNVFTYGCRTPRCNHLTLLHEHVLPFLLAKQSPTIFDYRSCKFDMQPCKEATGRVVVWKMGVLNSFTLESTFCGSSFAETKKQFSMNDLKGIGESLGKAIHSFHCFLKNDKYKKRILSEIATDLLLKVSSGRYNMTDKLPSIRASQHHILYSPGESALQKFYKTDISSLEKESSTSGSDSENDTFSWRPVKDVSFSSSDMEKKKTKRKKVMTKTVKSILPLTSTVSTTKSTSIKGARCATSPMQDQFKLPQIKQRKEVPLYHNHNGAAAASMPLKLPAGPKFVSKYQDRSSGGIPIFSEERIKERKDKGLLQTIAKNSFSTLNTTESLTRHDSKSLWTLSKRMDGQHYTTADKKAQVSFFSDYYNQKLIQRKAKTLRMEHLKLSPQLEKFIKDSWKI